MADQAMSQLNLNQGAGEWRENPRQAAKRRKQARNKAAFQDSMANMNTIKTTNAVDPSWSGPGLYAPDPTGPKDAPKWEDDAGNKASQKTPAQLEKERIEEKLLYWPWRQSIPRDLVTLGPYLLNNLRDSLKPGQPFALTEVKQTCLLFEKLFTNELIRQKIVELIFENHSTASKFAATSRQSWQYITSDTAHWDFTRALFNNCEQPREDISSTNSAAQGSVASVVIISPIRGPIQHPEDIEDQDFVQEQKADRSFHYQDQMMSMHKMCLSMSNFKDFFRNLQLHNLPFLTTSILSLIIPMMQNLTVLGVYKCQLIHIGDAMKLLDIIQTDRPKGKENQISLDFYPNYHQGPVSHAGYEYYVGSYGVTWDNWNGDTRLGVWQLISVILPQALRQKQDFWSKHTMFRQWLDKSPCWRVEDTLVTLIRAPSDARTDEQVDEDFVVMCDFPNTGGSVKKFKGKVPNRSEGYIWMLERHPCHVCQLNVLGIFHLYNDIRWAGVQRLNGAQAQLTCLGCLLTGVLNKERDHYKRQKRGVIKDWLCAKDVAGNDEWNQNNLSKALSDFQTLNIIGKARVLDCIRCKAMSKSVHAIDREHDEQQVPLNDQEKARLGMKNRSPTVDSKDPVFDPWNWIDTSRKWAHGHGDPY